MKSLLLVVFVLALVLFIAGCTQNAAPGQAAAPVTPASDTIRIAPSPLGNILADANGRTLYYFATDIPASGASTCSGSCAGIWPVFSAGTVAVSPPLMASDFSYFVRADGTNQTTYRGRPLYYFWRDASQGEVYGENVTGNWFVVKPDETVMIAQRSDTGLYLTDKMGNSLYYFAKDTPGASTCAGGCIAKWPPFSIATFSAPSALSPSAFSVIVRADGMNQTTYMGRPLYYFANDTKPGDTNGEGFNNLWYVAGINGTLPVSSPPTATTVPAVTTVPTASMVPYSGGYGY